MKKKFSAAALLMTLFTLIFSLSAHAVSFSDIGSSQYKEAVVTLSNLNVIDGYEDGTFKPEGTITRAEFAKMLVCVMGFGDSVYYGTPLFTDIDMWAKNYISTAYGLGIVNGMDDYTFAPDDPVTYEQAQKMLVCALGYEENAAAKGGWPDGYISVAGELKLKNGITGLANGDSAPRGAIAQLMYNALNVTIKEFRNAQWEVTDKTLLNDYLNVVKLKGTLVGVADYTTDECTAKLAAYQMDVMNNSGEELVINFKDYTQNVTDINKFIGNMITVYYHLDELSEEKTLIALDNETIKNVETIVRYDDIISYSGSSLSYSDSEGKRKTLKINMKSVSVRYNGRPVNKDEDVTLGGHSFSLEEALSEWLTPEGDNFIYGDVKFTDSGSDGVIDLIQIYDYETIVAYQAPKTSDYRITDKLISGNYLILDPNSSDYSYTIQKDGAQIELTAIAAGDIVLYAKSLDGSLYTCYASSKQVSGSITTIENNYVYINKTKYLKGSMCDEYISKNQSGRTLKVGVSGTFNVDTYGTVVYGTINSAVENLPYAYIANAAVEPGEDAGYITLYTDGSAAKICKMKDKVKFNGKSMDYASVVDELEETAKFCNDDLSDEWKTLIYGNSEPNVSPYSQPARVSLSDGQIASIVTVDHDSAGSQNENTDSVVKYSPISQCVFTSSSSSITKKGSFKQAGSSSTTLFSTDDSTKIIYVPKDRKDRTAYASKGFQNNTRYFVEAYDLNSAKVAKLVLVYSNKDNTITEVSKDTNFGIVASIPEASYDENTGDTSQKISVFFGPNNSSQTTEKSWQTSSESEFADIEVGDVIQFAYDTSNLAKNRINNIKFKDIAEVLDGESESGKLYDWSASQTPSEENNHQPLKFDYRFKYFNASSNEYTDEMHLNNTMYYIYSRACMYNVSQVFEEDKKLYVTKDGFDADGNLDDSNYEEVEITSSTKFLRMETNRKSLSKYAEDTTTDLTIMDLKSAQYYGTECSKILVISSKGTAKLIVIYN